MCNGEKKSRQSTCSWSCLQWKRKTRCGEEKRTGSTPVARVDSNEKARCAREQAMDVSLELFAMEKIDARWRGRDSGQCTCKPE